MAKEPSHRSRPRLGSTLLILSWLLLLGALGAAAGYVLVPASEAPPEAVTVTLSAPPAASPAPAPAAAQDEPKAAAGEEPPPAMAQAEPQDGEAAVAPETRAEPAPPAAAAGTPLWQRNRQPFPAGERRPRIAVVLTGLGLASATTEAAIRQLPAAVTLSFTPYARGLDGWVDRARAQGHEVMLDLPMEPTSYPDDDPGPQALLTALSPEQNQERLRWTLARASGYVGVAGVMGSRFAASEKHLLPILEELREQGAIFLDNRASEDAIAGALAARLGAPSAVNDRTLDSAQSNRLAIESRLVQVEEIAQSQGHAVAMGRPYPVTLEVLRDWSAELEARGFVLAPISAVVERAAIETSPTQSSQAR